MFFSNLRLYHSKLPINQYYLYVTNPAHIADIERANVGIHSLNPAEYVPQNVALGYARPDSVVCCAAYQHG